MTPSAPQRHASVADLVAARAGRGQHRPLLTCYDEVTGARTELSYATLDNWAAKTANLLTEEFDIELGDTVELDLTGHWTTVALLLACWKLGAAAGSGAAFHDVVLTCCHEAQLEHHSHGRLLVIGDGLAAEPTVPVTARDHLVVLADEVNAFADDYDSSAVTAETPAVHGPDARLDHAALLARGERWRARVGKNARVALALPLDHPVAAEILVAVLLGGGSLLASRGDRHVPRWDRLTVERVNALIGPQAALDEAGPPPDGISALPIDAGAAGAGSGQDGR